MLINKEIPTPARVFDATAEAVVDFGTRNAWNLPMGDAFEDVSARIGGLQPHLERHFGLTLADHEGPTLLMYPPGGFYEPHVDRAAGNGPHGAVRARRVSIVIFVNATRPQPQADEYAGGALTFYGLIDDPVWRDYGFAIDPAPGLLVAFPSHLRHEVTPVTAGDRYTIVDWFTA